MVALLSSTGKTAAEIGYNGTVPTSIIFKPLNQTDKPVYWPIKDWQELEDYINHAIQGRLHANS